MTPIRFLVAYDVSDSQSRSRIHRQLRKVGFWAQKSVFECELKRPELEILIMQLLEYLDAETDRLLVVPNITANADSKLGNSLHLPDGDDWIFC